MERECYWKDLGPVTQPGKYYVASLGYIEVSQEDINRSQQFHGNILLDITDVPARGFYGNIQPSTTIVELRISNMRHDLEDSAMTVPST